MIWGDDGWISLSENGTFLVIDFSPVSTLAGSGSHPMFLSYDGRPTMLSILKVSFVRAAHGNGGGRFGSTLAPD
jgi:hypothetical protein